MTKIYEKGIEVQIKEALSAKKYLLCCSLEALLFPKRVYDKCDSPLFIASSFAAEVLNGIR